MNDVLSACECSLSSQHTNGGGDTQTLTAIIDFVCLNFLHSEAVGMLKHCPCTLTLFRAFTPEPPSETSYYFWKVLKKNQFSF